MFVKHNLAAETWGRAGTFDPDAWQVTPEGLYGEALVNSGVLGRYVMDLVRSGDGAWSSATMPHLAKIRKDGYVEEWAIVEGSVLHCDEAASVKGTTVAHLRGLVGGLPDDDELVMRRSYWIMPAGKEVNTPVNDPASSGVVSGQQAGAIVPASGGDGAGNGNRQELSDIVAEIRHLRSEIQARPTQALAPNGPPPAGNIQVSSKWDGVSALGMLLWAQHRRINGPRLGRTFQADEEFMRALVDHARDLHEAQEKPGVLPSANSYMRAVDEESYEMIHRKVPYLRANEAMQSTLAGSGDEWVPTLMSSVAYHAFRHESRILSLFPAFKMPSNPYNYPTLDNSLNLRRRVLEMTDRSQVSIPTSTFADSKPVSAAITFSAGKIGGLSIASRELFEDAGISVADEMATAFARAGASTIDDVLLNGDEQTGATNISHYGAAPAGTAYDGYLVLDGLRKQAATNSDQANETDATLDDESIIQGLKLMGARGRLALDKTRLVCVIDPGVHWKLLPLAEFVTYDKVGALAAILTGMVGVWYGVSTIVSDELEYLTTATNRVPSTHAGVDGQLLTINKDIFKVGYMREIQVEAGPVMHTDAYVMSWSVRLDLQGMETGGVANITDITV